MAAFEVMRIEHRVVASAVGGLRVDERIDAVFAVLAAAGRVPTAGRAAIAAEAATAEDERLLGVRRGAPLLVERRLINDQDGAPLELTESRYVAARYGLEVDFDVELPE